LWQGEGVRVFSSVRNACLGLAFAAFAPACRNTTPEETPAPLASAASAPDAGPLRRPTRRHYLARTAEQCEVYSVDLDIVSPAERTPCPQDLQVGERIRVAGKACFREGQPDRSQPVVCPGPLMKADQRERDGGL
jgi:hypothetical protein